MQGTPALAIASNPELGLGLGLGLGLACVGDGLADARKEIILRRRETSLKIGSYNRSKIEFEKLGLRLGLGFEFGLGSGLGSGLGLGIYDTCYLVLGEGTGERFHPAN